MIGKLISLAGAWLLVSSCLPLHVSSDTFDSNGFEARELKLYLSYGTGFDYDEVEYYPRGTITVRNFQGPKFASQQEKISSEEIKKLEGLALVDEYYFLKITIKFPSGEKTFRTFSPLKSLLDSGFSDIISIHLAPTGEIFSISYAMTLRGYKSTSRILTPSYYNTTLTVHSGEVGPVPETGPYLEKLEREKLAREQGDEGRDNRSFLAKYWMYIIPVVLIIFLSGASNPEGGS